MVYVGRIVRNRPKKRPKMTGTRRRLFEDHKTLCAYCRRATEMPSMIHGTHHHLTATVEHIVPLCRGGSMKGDNITLSCAFCNTLKADMTPHEWAQFMSDNPRWWESPKFRRKKKCVVALQSNRIPSPPALEQTRYFLNEAARRASEAQA